MSDWYTTLPGLLDRAWDRLSAGVEDADAPARRPVFATVDPDGAPQARIVVLRGADRLAATLRLHTDGATPKVTELDATPRAALHVWEPALNLQLRLAGAATVRAGTDAEWSALHDASRGNYGVEPVPGTPIPVSDAFTRIAKRNRFAIIEVRLDRIETLVLAPDHHRRAVFEATDAWAGRWIAP